MRTSNHYISHYQEHQTMMNRGWTPLGPGDADAVSGKFFTFFFLIPLTILVHRHYALTLP